MFKAARFERTNKIGLQAEVLPLRGVNIAIKRDLIRRCRLVISARIEVGINLVIITKESTEIGFEIVGEFMAEGGAENMRFQFGEILQLVAKDDVLKGLHRSSVASRGDAAVNKPLVIGIFIRQIERCSRAQLRAENGIDANSRTIIEIAVIVQIFISGIDPDACRIAHLEIEIALHAECAESVNRQLSAAKCLANDRLLGDPVDDPARAAASEQERIGPAQDFDLLQIVKRAVILDIIAHPVDEEIGGRAHSAKDYGIAVAFALGCVYTGGVVDNLRDGIKAALGNLVRGNDRQALRHINDRCRAAQSVDLIGIKDLAGHHDLRFGIAPCVITGLSRGIVRAPRRVRVIGLCGKSKHGAGENRGNDPSDVIVGKWAGERGNFGQ